MHISFTITMGWWLIPAIITLISFAFTYKVVWIDYARDDWGQGLILLFYGSIAAIVSLLSWLIYFIIF